MFSLKNTAEESMKSDGDKEEDDFLTDEDEEMEVDKQVVQKRKKVWNNICAHVGSVSSMLFGGFPWRAIMLLYLCLLGPGQWFSEEIQK